MVVFDVLRATTSITAAMAAGVAAIHVFGSVDDVRQAAAATGPDVLLCGESNCLPPPGFTLGNSPGAFRPDLHAGKTAYLSTTNGTRAILAAAGAAHRFAGALVNAAAVAQAVWLVVGGGDVVLLCAGTNGAVAAEDVVGAGAVAEALRAGGTVNLASDSARLATSAFLQNRDDLPWFLRSTAGGRNVIDAGLEDDIDFAARLDVLNAVGAISGDAPPVIRLSPAS